MSLVLRCSHLNRALAIQGGILDILKDKNERQLVVLSGLSILMLIISGARFL